MKLGLIGEVLGHSLSPIIHEKLFHKLSIPGRYDLIEIPKNHFAEVLRDTLTACDGLNVTIPYKLDVIPFLDDISPEAKTIGAVNTIAKADGKLVGYNTDYFGFQRTLRKIDAKVNGKTAVVLGHGGASSSSAFMMKAQQRSASSPAIRRRWTPISAPLQKKSAASVSWTTPLLKERQKAHFS